MPEQIFSENVMQIVAIFGGNYLARKSKALESEQIIKVIAQAVTLEQSIEFFRKLGLPDYGFLKDYMESIIMLIAVAATSVVYDAILEAAQGKPVNLNKEDVKLGLMQGLIVAAGNLTSLY